MQVVISPTDLEGAPEHVTEWVRSQLFKSTDEPAEPEKWQEPEVTPKQCHDAALELIKANGEPALKAVLDKFGIGSVKECPKDKLADFYAELAIS